MSGIEIVIALNVVTGLISGGVTLLVNRFANKKNKKLLNCINENVEASKKWISFVFIRKEPWW